MTLLEDARALLAQGPLCDSCLGRVFADRSFGLTNARRGEALRVALAMDADEDFEPFGGGCWVCEDRSREFEEWATWVANELSDLTFETYRVGTRVPPLIEENERLLREDAGLDPGAGEPFKGEFNREVGKRVGAMLDVEVEFGRPDVEVLLDLEGERVEVQVNSAFVYGRYRKLERGVPQTEWPCRECDGRGTRDGEACDHCDGTGYLYETSVEQQVAPAVCEAMDGDGATFHGAGREDVDALMLGTGRPFVVEVSHPRDRFPDVDAIEGEIDERAADVEVEDLALATYEMVERVKELDATKTYRAQVEFAANVDPDEFRAALERLDGATIEQDTPERVAHRRADRTRTRTVRAIDGDLADPRHATVEVLGEGGLYIKELIHGDGGRTRPSLAGLLGVAADVTALDVIAVEAEAGRFLEPEYRREPP